MANTKGGQKKKNAIADFFSMLGKDLKEIGITFKEGDFKISFLIFGFGSLLRGLWLRGLALLAAECGLLYFIFSFGWSYFSKIGTLGTIATTKQGRKTVYGDNSFLILLFGLLTLFAVVAFIAIWRINVRVNRNEELIIKSGRKLPSNIDDFKGWK